MFFMKILLDVLKGKDYGTHWLSSEEQMFEFLNLVHREISLCFFWCFRLRDKRVWVCDFSPYLLYMRIQLVIEKTDYELFSTTCELFPLFFAQNQQWSRVPIYSTLTKKKRSGL